MKATEITNIKKFTGDLFAGEGFDSFAVAEASFTTRISVDIDGHVNQGAEERELALWSEVKKLCYQVVSGKQLPVRFKIVLMVPGSKIESFIRNSGVPVRPEDVGALSLNIRYESGKLECTTGTALKTFTLDKSLENAWDASMAKFLGKYNVQ